ncbi:MAG: hypothetical protein HXK75_01730 [Granulicatella sp.]|nr:hypothetical protein [Granulicatella sp.]
MEIKISDLRQLGLSGNATVKLGKDYKFPYTIAEIRKDGIYVPIKNAIINGKEADIKMRESFPNIYKHILTIKQGNILVAERKNDRLVVNVSYEKRLR